MRPMLWLNNRSSYDVIRVGKKDGCLSKGNVPEVGIFEHLRVSRATLSLLSGRFSYIATVDEMKKLCVSGPLTALFLKGTATLVWVATFHVALPVVLVISNVTLYSAVT